MWDTIYYLIIVIYYFRYFYVKKKRYFRFRAFISLFFGVFNVVQSNQDFICFRSRLRVSSCPRFCFYYLNTLQPPKAIQFSNFVYYFLQWILVLSPCGFKVYYPETNNLASVPSREYRVCFFQASATSQPLVNVYLK